MSYKICIVCGTAVDSKDTICPSCGNLVMYVENKLSKGVANVTPT